MGASLDLIELALFRRRPEAVLFDIDGTLASTEHRAHLVERPSGLRDWSTFHGGMSVDAPISGTVRKAREAAAQGKRVVLLSLRPERFRGATEVWMKEHGVPYDEMFLRPEGTSSIRGPEMKRRIYLDSIKPKYDVEAAYDDYDPNLVMFEQEGVRVVKIVDPEHAPRRGRPARDPKYPGHRPSEAYIPPHERMTKGGRVMVKGHWRKIRRLGRQKWSWPGDLIDPL